MSHPALKRGAQALGGRMRAGRVVGLANLGNTCFLNSVLQSLASLSPFVEQLRSSVDTRRENRGLSNELLKVLDKLKPGSECSDSFHAPQQLVDLIHTGSRQLRRNQPQDAEELLHILVEMVEKELKKPPGGFRGLAKCLPAKMLPPLPMPSAATRFANPLAGWTAKHIECRSCHHKHPIRNGEFIDLSLPLPSQWRKASCVSLPSRNGSRISGGSVGHLPSRFSALQIQEGSGQRPVHLMDLIRQEMMEEVVQDVECLNCARQESLDQNQTELDGHRQYVDSLKRLEGQYGEVLATAEGLLAEAQARKGRLESLDPDDDGEPWAEEGITPFRREATLRTLFSRLPPLLCFHLCRREMDSMGRMTKNGQMIQFPLMTDMSPLSLYGGTLWGKDATPSFARGGGLSNSYQYLLQAVIVHHGSAEGGHYTTYRRVSAVERGMVEGAEGLLSPDINEWVHVSDEIVSPATVEEVTSAEAYMLFYQSVASLSDPSTPSLADSGTLPVRIVESGTRAHVSQSL